VVGSSFVTLLLGDVTPAQSADEAIRVELARAEQFRQPARGDVAAEVHLPEAVLGLDEALRDEEVVRGGCLDDGDGRTIAGHRDRVVEP
jgi:hypothetical protein